MKSFLKSITRHKLTYIILNIAKYRPLKPVSIGSLRLLKETLQKLSLVTIV